MGTKKEVRKAEKHVKEMTSDKSAQIAIISKAQSLTADNEHNVTVLAIVKNRIIHSK